MCDCCARCLNKQTPADMPPFISWEAAQLLLPILLCGLLAVCVQACSAPAPGAGSTSHQRAGGDTAAARQARDDAMHDRWVVLFYNNWMGTKWRANRLLQHVGWHDTLQPALAWSLNSPLAMHDRWAVLFSSLDYMAQAATSCWQLTAAGWPALCIAQSFA